MQTTIDYIDGVIRSLEGITPDYHSESRTIGKAISLLHEYQTLIVKNHVEEKPVPPPSTLLTG